MALKNRTLFLRVRLYAVEQGDVLGEEAAVRHVCSFTLLYDENNLPHWILPKGEVSSLDDFVFYDFCMICFTGLRLRRPNLHPKTPWHLSWTDLKPRYGGQPPPYTLQLVQKKDLQL